MYVDSSSSTVNGKKYRRHLLRESYREDGKVKHRTIANLSQCSPEEIEAIRLALRHKDDLTRIIEEKSRLALRQGLSVGAVWLVYDMARQLGIAKALGDSHQGRLALWQVIARVIDQGSRLSAVRLAGSHAACDIVGMDRFNEETLYKNLEWLSDRQSAIEDKMAGKRKDAGVSDVFLYDVTSSYLEGVDNDLAAFGYNRDGKRGKMQIVIGLLCDAQGCPLSIEVFPGNTQDPQTMGSQIAKAAERFGAQAVTFVGDRGMIKGPQIKDLEQSSFHYITAITKAQIRKMMKQGAFQMDIFDEELAEIETQDIRYILRRNPVRVAEIAASRKSKLEALEETIRERNAYLKEHPRARVAVAVRKVMSKAKGLKIAAWASCQGDEKNRTIDLKIERHALDEEAKLDGCYVLKTDLPAEQADKETVHGRYKDLAWVEQAFRTSKTTQLEVRPVYVQREKRTRGHVFVVMMAYRIVRELAERWSDFNLTVQEGIDQLTTLIATDIMQNGDSIACQIPEPRPLLKNLLDAARVRLPQALPRRGVIVTTKRKLSNIRKKN